MVQLTIAYVGLGIVLLLGADTFIVQPANHRFACEVSARDRPWRVKRIGGVRRRTCAPVAFVTVAALTRPHVWRSDDFSSGREMRA